MNTVLGYIGAYFWNVITSIGAIIFTILNALIRRLIMLLYHIISGPYTVVLNMIKCLKNSKTQQKSIIKRIVKGLLNFLAWVGRILSKALDIVLIGELLDFVFQIVKPNQRTLTEIEKKEAQKVFGKGLAYWSIRIDESSLLAWMGARFVGSKNMGVTTFHTINFTRKINSRPGNGDMEWLIHELAHVSQMEHVGIQYIVEALVAQNSGGYNYGSPHDLLGKKLKEFNREQQAEIAAHYYQDVLYGSTSTHYFMPLLEEFRNTHSLWWQ